MTSGYKIVGANEIRDGKYKIDEWQKWSEPVGLDRNGFSFCREAPLCGVFSTFQLEPAYIRVECRESIKHARDGRSTCKEIKMIDIITPREWNRICTGKFTTPNGTTRYYKDGQLDREDGPAVQYPNGTEIWYRNGSLHCDDGPAVRCHDGTKIWFQAGVCSRKDGPCFVWPNGKEWNLYQPITSVSCAFSIYVTSIRMKAVLSTMIPNNFMKPDNVLSSKLLHIPDFENGVLVKFMDNTKVLYLNYHYYQINYSL